MKITIFSVILIKSKFWKCCLINEDEFRSFMTENVSLGNTIKLKIFKGLIRSKVIKLLMVRNQPVVQKNDYLYLL